VVNRYNTDTYTGGTVYLGKDVMGSVRGISNDYGLLEDRYEYDAFGKPYKGDLNNGMNMGYTGKPYDTTTGMYNYGYRDYQPETARFTTVDPIRDGANWFAYVNNDPVNWVDLWGLSASDPKNQTNNLPSVSEGKSRITGEIGTTGIKYTAVTTYYEDVHKVDVSVFNSTISNGYKTRDDEIYSLFSTNISTTIITQNGERELKTSTYTTQTDGLGFGDSLAIPLSKEEQFIATYSTFVLEAYNTQTAEGTVVFRK
jgi:RHS repeat-associated protein